MIARHAAAIVAGGDPAKLTKSGKPSTQALESATGLDDISAAERDAALAG
ncbi:MAG: hypothetical protein OXG40_01060 [Acidimicrobiaceae bacterium]|nr:hypothetical protein [Acidimicrobiaceae bacterium]